MPANIQLLIQKFLSNSCSPDEVDELVQFLASPVHQQLADELIIQQLAKEYKPVTDDNKELNERLQKRLQEILRQPQQEVNGELLVGSGEEEAVSSQPIVVSMKGKMHLWKKIAVAASILLFVSFAVYFILSTSSKLATEGHEGPVVEVPHDVPAPDRNRAQITLANGTTVYLDSAANGEIVNANGVQVVKSEDGRIEYRRPSSVVSGPVQYNTLMNPRGSRVIDITLADGSRVWLNAGSSVTYPVAFVGNERKVNITGEAYFEVSTKYDVRGTVKQPFIVSANNKADVTVLGTHFNVNAYDDEEDIKVTLLEGSVKVHPVADSRKSIVIKPGEQAKIVSGESSVVRNVDVEQVMAWKNGLFLFKSTDIKTLMRQLTRWYDVEVFYETIPSTGFNAKISRETPLSSILKALELTGEVKFKIEGTSVTVMK